MAAMASNWLKNWKSLKIFRTTGWIEAKFSQNAGTVHPLGQMRASSNQIIVLQQLKRKMLKLWWFQSYRNAINHMRYLNCLLNRRYMQLNRGLTICKVVVF
jgi:hypothetical protein